MNSAYRARLERAKKANRENIERDERLKADIKDLVLKLLADRKNKDISDVIGVSTSTITQYRNGNTKPKVKWSLEFAELIIDKIEDGEL